LRVATIDIGTNSVLLLIASASGQGGIVALHEASTITRLGQSVDKTRKLHPEAIERTLACLRDYGDRIGRYSVDRLDVVSTSAARDARGVDGFLDAAQSVLGKRPRVIGGEQEARLTFRGALTGLSSLDGPVAVFDIGGGSTEVVFGMCQPGQLPVVEQATSIDIGCVRLTERHLRSDPPQAYELRDADSACRDALSVLPEGTGSHSWVGIGGTVTTLMAVELGLDEYDVARIHGATLTRSAVASMRKRLADLPLAARARVPGLEPKRSDVIVAGTILVQELLSRSGQALCRISDRGVRWGLALELCGTTL